MNDLFPNDVMQYLENEYGKEFSALSTDEQAILATIYLENEANHQRLKTLLPNHPADITKMLQHLVKQGMLVSTGGRWAVYSLASDNSLAGNDQSLAGASTGLNEPSYPNNEPSYPNNEPSYPNNNQSLTDKNAGLTGKSLRIKTILELCLEKPLSSGEIARRLGLNLQGLRNRYLADLVKNEYLAYTYPDNPKDRRQTYITTDKGKTFIRS